MKNMVKANIANATVSNNLVYTPSSPSVATKAKSTPEKIQPNPASISF